MIKLPEADTAPLRLNPAYQFARRYAFAVYPMRAVYTFIPKNACSTLRFSVAVANGFLTPTADVNWIHANNDAFLASQEFLATCDYAFVVLRCPYRRVASAYLDKIVGGQRHLKGLLPPARRHLYRAFGRQVLARRIQALSFEDFLARIAKQDPTEMDDHWRPQSDFLLFRTYDDYFCLEDFQTAQTELALRGLQVFDTRQRLKHDLSHYDRCTGDFATLPAQEIATLKRGGLIPEVASLYSDRAKALVDHIYAADIALYADRFGRGAMVF